MATIDYVKKEMFFKIVYYGPEGSGKTTNISMIYNRIPKGCKPELKSVPSPFDSSVLFDLLQFEFKMENGFVGKLALHSCPGHGDCNSSRKLVLKGVDGIVMVFDAAADKIEQNIESYTNLKNNIREYGYKLKFIPTLFQYNKRDLPNALMQAELNERLNNDKHPSVEVIAVKDKGVIDSLKMIVSSVYCQLNSKYATKEESMVSPDIDILQPVEDIKEKSNSSSSDEAFFDLESLL